MAGEGLRPFPPKSCPPGFVELLDACWHADPAQRPTFDQVRGAASILGLAALWFIKHLHYGHGSWYLHHCAFSLCCVQT